MTSVRIALIVLAALLVSLIALPAAWHLPAGFVVWLVLRFLVPDVHRAFGRPRRWLGLLALLSVLGAIFGPDDMRLLNLSLSFAGALSGTTMVVRAFALVALASVVSSGLPLRRWTQRVRHPFARRLFEVVVIASNLVPVQLRALSTASTTLGERRPGLLQLPKRLWLLSVHSSVRAAMLAENVALDMAIAAHNVATKTENS